MTRRHRPARREALAALALTASLAVTPILLAQAPSPAGKRPFSLEDLSRIKSVAGMALSPDGRSAVYVVGTNDLGAAKRRTNLWRLDLSVPGAAPRQLTFADASDSSPQFTPDSKEIAFVSSRSGESQLWLMPADGGEPRKRTDVPGGISGPVFSKDGRKVAFAADVSPECGADTACNRKADELREKSKLVAHLADDLLYRHWTGWKDGKRSHVLVMDLTDDKAPLVDATPGDFDAPVFSPGGGTDYAFSPDGKELAFGSNHDADEESSTNGDIWLVRLDGKPEDWKAPKNVTGRNAAFDGSPVYSPDGRFLAFRNQAVARYESDRFRISLYDRSTGQIRSLTEGFDNTIRDVVFSKDGQRIYFTAEVKGRTPLHELNLATGEIRVVHSVGFLDGFEISPDGRFAVVSRRRIHEPSELYRIDLPRAGATANEVGTRLTSHNADLVAQVDLRVAEEHFVPGADGKKVQVWLVKPHGFDPKKKYPTILNIHGGPQQMWADSLRGDWQVYPGAGYVVAFANPHGSTGFGQEYTSAISGDWDGKVMKDLTLVTEWLARQPFVDAGRMGAMGWSWGGYAVMWLEGHSTAFKALASMMGLYDMRTFYSSTEEIWFPAWDFKGAPWENKALYDRASPSSAVLSFKTPCLVLTGMKDYRVPYSQSLMFFNDLQKRGVPSRLIVWEKAGHWPSWYEMNLYYAAHLDWFHKYLGGPPSPWDPADMVKGKLPGKAE